MHRRKKNRGQGMTEYIVIAALVAIGSIGVITIFGDNVRNLFGASSSAIAGSGNVANGGRAANPQLARKTLSNFGETGSSSSNQGGGGGGPSPQSGQRQQQ